MALPGANDFAPSLSGNLGWGRFGLANEGMEDRRIAQPAPGVALHVDPGGGPGGDGQCHDLDADGLPEDDPDSSDDNCTSRQFADSMAANGWTWDSDLWHWHEVGAPHDELAWADRVFMPSTCWSTPSDA